MDNDTDVLLIRKDPHTFEKTTVFFYSSSFYTLLNILN